ncbi:extracellular superoxide dismutase [Cu-Zn], partial [Dermacentor silvarum]|uniref:extracellular superoxide dismutase [Cu-Zn] n=1 Tax=Dermacentor silvarum TaxID=543639 RepID=UPI0018992A96
PGYISLLRGTATTNDDDSEDEGGESGVDRHTKERKSGRVLSNTLESKLHGEDYDSDEVGGNDQEGSQRSHNRSHHQHHGKEPSLHHDSEAAHHGPRHGEQNRLLHREDAKELKLSATQYDFAICRLQPNTAIAKELQQPVHGLISLWQQKGGRDLNVHVHVMGLKVNDSARDHRAFMHGMHVHQLGNLSDSCQSTGPHFNPTNTTHGDRRSTVRHVGDFGNIACDKHGESNVIFTDTVASLTGPHSIVGRSINIHASMDDLGRNTDNPASVSSGDSGPRVACCVVEKVDKLPQLSSKAARRILRDIMQPFSDFESE